MTSGCCSVVKVKFHTSELFRISLPRISTVISFVCTVSRASTLGVGTVEGHPFQTGIRRHCRYARIASSEVLGFNVKEYESVAGAKKQL